MLLHFFFIADFIVIAHTHVLTTQFLSLTYFFLSFFLSVAVSAAVVFCHGSMQIGNAYYLTITFYFLHKGVGINRIDIAQIIVACVDTQIHDNCIKLLILIGVSVAHWFIGANCNMNRKWN